MRKEYIRKGICIWCLKDKTKGITFYRQPHTITRQIGVTPIGFDICDDCNSYFGTSSRQDLLTVSPEVAFMEIFKIIQFLRKPDKNESSYLELKSRYFNYHHTEASIKVNKTYGLKPKFIKNFTRQFKRGVYEAFLQELHRCTENGLDQSFSKIRDFARWDKGDIPLYFLRNSGTYFLEEKAENPSLTFTESTLRNIYGLGFFQLKVLCHVFFLEVTPRATISREIYLKKEYKKWLGNKSIFSDLVRMEYITDLDFKVRSLNTSHT